MKTFIRKGKGTSTVKTILKNKFGMSLLDLKAYYIATGIIECGISKGQTQIDGTEQSPQMDPQKYNHLIKTKNKNNGQCIFGYPYAKK